MGVRGEDITRSVFLRLFPAVCVLVPWRQETEAHAAFFFCLVSEDHLTLARKLDKRGEKTISRSELYKNQTEDFEA